MVLYDLPNVSRILIWDLSYRDLSHLFTSETFAGDRNFNDLESKEWKQEDFSV